MQPLRQRTLDVMLRLVELCAELGGTRAGARLARRSARSRRAATRRRAWRARARRFAAVAERGRQGRRHLLHRAARPRETQFINTVEDAVRMVKAVDHPAFRTMIDTSAAGSTEKRAGGRPDRPVAAGRHGRACPGQRPQPARPRPGRPTGSRPSSRPCSARATTGVVAIEPFVYEPDGAACAARSIGYVRGVLEGLAWPR